MNFKIFTSLLATFIFVGCFDVNLKSQLPNNDIYELDALKSYSSQSCNAYNFIAISNISVPSEFDNRIKIKEGDKISYLPNVVLSKSISENLESIIIKYFNAKCIKTIIPPFSGINVESYLKLRIVDFMIDKDSNAAVVSIFYQIYQQGTILQSGLLASSVEVKEDNYIKALQEANLEIISTLANKIISK